VQVTILEGQVDRIFFHPVERMLLLVLKGEPAVHRLRVSADAGYMTSVMLTKPGDGIRLAERGGHIDKWQNYDIDRGDLLG
jgi:hypothetical protein